MAISIVICTFNRIEILKKTLNVFIQRCGLYFGDSANEVLVVDNNSSDSTAVEISSLIRRYSFIRYFLETEQGLSAARNRGINEAKNEIICFLDDDVIVCEEFASRIENAFKDKSTNAISGKVIAYNADLPCWIPSSYYFLLSLLDMGGKRKQIDCMLGANCAVRRSVFMRIGFFDNNLGRKGKKLMGCEEVDLSWRMRKEGIAIFYEPDIYVEHIIDSKINEIYIIDYSERLGASIRYLEAKHKKYGTIVLRFLYGLLIEAVYFKNRSLKKDFRKAYLYYYYRGYLQSISGLFGIN